mgnify:CR=1 FL=1
MSNQRIIDQRSFSGFMNTDDNEAIVAPGQHIDARNIRFRGQPGNMRAENVPGTVLITNDYLPVGDNECIGSFYDSIKQRIIWFNYNSNSKHGIYQYDLLTKTVTPLLICFTNSTTDILGFSLDFPIASVNIIYTTEEDGDLLTWVARNKRPKILNLLSAKNNIYGSDWLEEYLDVAKAPFFIPMQCAFEDDLDVTVNNLRKPLFVAKYRPVYDDNLKGVFSAWSNMAIPFNYTIPEVQANPQKNAKIRCVIQTGSAEVKKIEIVFAQLGGPEAQEGTTWSDFFQVVVLDKAKLSIPDNDTYIYDFYNNEAYSDIDVKESNLPFDYVPDLANTQELLNGNVIVYGGITEGKNPVTVEGVATNKDGSTPLYEKPFVNPVDIIMSVTQAGTNGFQLDEDIKIIILGNGRPNYTYNIEVDISGTPETISYTALPTEGPEEIIDGLRLVAIGLGYTVVSFTNRTLTIFKTGQQLLNYYIEGADFTLTNSMVVNDTAKTITITGKSDWFIYFFKGTQFYLSLVPSNLITTVSQNIVGSDLVVTYTGDAFNNTGLTTISFQPNLNESIPSYTPSSKRSLALVYFDKKGKTDGVLYSPEMSVNIDYYVIETPFDEINFKIPYINFSITSPPPIWADYYHIVRSDNLSDLRFLWWVTNKTYKDDKYAYICIESIQAYKLTNLSSIIAYKFSPGDRIRFQMLYNPDGTADTVYQNEYDYEIADQLLDQEINGIKLIGQWLKIILPATSSTFNFGDGSNNDYDYYLIKLYTPQKSTNPELRLYKEFDQEYAIINPGTSLRCHQGQLQNQSDNLVTPALFKLECGDAYYRRRDINVGSVISFDFKEQLMSDGYILPQELVKQVLPSNDILAAPSVAWQEYVNSDTAPGWSINVAYNSYDFSIKGVLNLFANNAHPGGFKIKCWVIHGNTANSADLYSTTGPVTAGQHIVVNVNVTINCPTGSKVYIVYQTSDDSISITVRSGNLVFAQLGTNILAGIFDANFSDFYVSTVNQNGRAWGYNPDEKTTKFGTLLRWGLNYQQNTNINQINRFFPTNFNEIDRAKGEIQRFKTRDRILRIFQNRGVGKYNIYSKFVQSGDANLLTTTDEILTQNNVSYYSGTFGLGDQYCGLISNKFQDHFIDPVRGYHVRLSEDGFTPVSELFKGQFKIQPLFPPYNNNYIRPNGSRAKILGVYDNFEENVIFELQSGHIGTTKIDAYTFSFHETAENERNKGYWTFYDYKDMDWMVSAENKVYLFKDGHLYILDNTQNYCNFFGVQYYPSITIPFNKNVSLTKTPLSGGYEANNNWVAEEIGDVYTSQPNAQTGLIQQSAIRDWNLDVQEGRYYFYLNKDANSLPEPLEGLNDGDVLKGVWIVVKFSYLGNQFAYLYLPYINFAISNRNF